MTVISRAELLLQAKNYSGSGDWLDESGNGHDAQFGTGTPGTNDPQSLPWDGDNYLLFPGVAGNNVEVTLAVTTIYDYTVTYEDDSSDTGTETSDGGGVVTFGDTDVKFDSLKVKLIDVVPDGGGATLALFDASLATEPFASFVDSKSKTWTINRSGSGLYVVDQPSFGLHTDDYFEIGAGLFLGQTDPVTLMVVARLPDVNSGAHQWLAGTGEDVTVVGYRLYAHSADNISARMKDASANSTIDLAPSPSDSTRFVSAMVRNIGDDDLEAFVDGVGSGSPTTDASTDTLVSVYGFFIGSGSGTYNFLSGEIMAVVLWLEALTDAEVVRAGNELVATVITINESIGITDATAPVKTIPVTIAESVGLTDTTTPVKTVSVVVLDSVGITDTVSPVKTVPVTITDAIGLTDTTTAAKSILVVVVDSIGITDTVARVANARRTVTEALGITDDTLRAVTITRTITDALGITDDVSGAITLVGFWVADPVEHTRLAPTTEDTV